MSDLVRPFKEALKSTLRPLQWRMETIQTKRRVAGANRDLDKAYVDPRIRYPSYKSFDDIIDVAALKSLDGYVRDRFAQRDKADEPFWAGHFTPNKTDNQLPGSRIAYLTELKDRVGGDDDYFNLDHSDQWQETEAAEEFSEVMAFVRTLPFKSTGRIILMYDMDGRTVTAHRDHPKVDVCHEFIWMRMNVVKQLYVMNSVTRERQNVDGHSAWFDTVNQFHGVDASEGLSISLRVDGKFTDELRARIPFSAQNAASTPSLWAAIGDKPAA